MWLPSSSSSSCRYASKLGFWDRPNVTSRPIHSLFNSCLLPHLHYLLTIPPLCSPYFFHNVIFLLTSVFPPSSSLLSSSPLFSPPVITSLLSLSLILPFLYFSLCPHSSFFSVILFSFLSCPLWTPHFSHISCLHSFHPLSNRTYIHTVYTFHNRIHTPVNQFLKSPPLFYIVLEPFTCPSLRFLPCFPLNPQFRSLFLIPNPFPFNFRSIR